MSHTLTINVYYIVKSRVKVKSETESIYAVEFVDSPGIAVFTTIDQVVNFLRQTIEENKTTKTKITIKFPQEARIIWTESLGALYLGLVEAEVKEYLLIIVV